MLIEEGKKALGREVVVMSDAKEDMIDDGTGAWEEEDAAGPSYSSISRSSSFRRNKRPRMLALPPPSYSHPTPPPTSSPRSLRFDHGYSCAHSPNTNLPIPLARGVSVESDALSVSHSSSFHEDERTWESPELRESMEKARARFLRTRGS